MLASNRYGLVLGFSRRSGFLEAWSYGKESPFKNYKNVLASALVGARPGVGSMWKMEWLEDALDAGAVGGGR